MKRRVVLSPESRNDLIDLYNYIADHSGDRQAILYVRRIRDHCLSFSEFSERGTRRDDIRPGLRIVGFERRVTLAFHFDDKTVVFDRILYGGRNL